MHLAKEAQQMKDASMDERREFYRRAIATRGEGHGMLRDKNYHNLADRDDVTVFDGKGSFVSGDTVKVQTPTDSFEIQSELIVINTGSQTVIPNIPGIQR